MSNPISKELFADFSKHFNLYKAPAEPVRPWVGLTDEDKQKLAAEQHDWEGLCSAVEAKLKEKNT